MCARRLEGVGKMSTKESNAAAGATPNNAIAAQPMVQVKQRSFAMLAFERLGMLPVLIVMYALFYGLTLYYSDDGTSNFLTSSNNMNILRQTAINLVLACGMTFVNHHQSIVCIC